MKKFSFYTLTSLLLLFTSCTKDDLNGLSNIGSGGNYGGFTFPNFYFYSIALDYVHLPVNHYFVYKDAATGATDSITVTQSIVTNEISSSTPIYTYEKYALTMASSINASWFRASASCHYNPAHTLSDSVDPNLTFMDEQTSLPTFWYPFTSSGTMQYLNIPALTIEGTMYTDVHEFIANNGLSSSDANYLQTTHYWVKGIGIIKKETRTSSSVKTYLLLRHG